MSIAVVQYPGNLGEFPHGVGRSDFKADIDCILNIYGMLSIYKRQSVTRRKRLRYASDSLNIKYSISNIQSSISVNLSGFYD
jgi:hypothetical protein